jgi:Ca2+-binding RTX toxin-like protein
VDASFGSATGAHLDVIDGDSEALDALTILPRGGVAVVGHTLAAGGSFITKLDSKGSPDPGMGPGGVKALAGLDVNAPVRLAALSDGRILTMGTSHTSTGVAYRFLGDFVAPSCAGKRATITGTQASDTLVGTPRVDVIAGLGGSDRITGLGKGDIVCGGPGADHIFGGAGNDQLYGQAGPDTISGGKGRDKLIGGQGHDTLHGGPGHDTVRR